SGRPFPWAAILATRSCLRTDRHSPLPQWAPADDPLARWSEASACVPSPGIGGRPAVPGQHLACSVDPCIRQEGGLRAAAVGDESLIGELIEDLEPEALPEPERLAGALLPGFEVHQHEAEVGGELLGRHGPVRRPSCPFL